MKYLDDRLLTVKDRRPVISGSTSPSPGTSAALSPRKVSSRNLSRNTSGCSDRQGRWASSPSSPISASKTHTWAHEGDHPRHRPGVPIVDMTHEVEPQDMREAAFLIDDYWRYFPRGRSMSPSSTPPWDARRPLIVSAKGHHFVGPTTASSPSSWTTPPISTSSRTQLHALPRQFHLPRPGRLLPRRRRLSRGYSPQAFGRKITDPVLLSDIHPVIEGRDA